MNDKLSAEKETESIDKLFLELSQFTKAKTKNDLQLQKLLYAVESKFKGETSFETALRYIREAESLGQKMIGNDANQET